MILGVLQNVPIQLCLKTHIFIGKNVWKLIFKTQNKKKRLTGL